MATNLVNLLTMTEITYDQLKAMYPNVSFPSLANLTDAALLSFNCATFTVDNYPSPADPYSTYALGPVVQNTDGTYAEHWVATTMPLDQAQNALLNALNNRYGNMYGTPVYFNGGLISLAWVTVTALRESSKITHKVHIADLHNSLLELSKTEAECLADTLVRLSVIIEQARYDHTVNIIKLLTVDTVRTYDITTGWPAVSATAAGGSIPVFTTLQPSQVP